VQFVVDGSKGGAGIGFGRGADPKRGRVQPSLQKLEIKIELPPVPMAKEGQGPGGRPSTAALTGVEGLLHGGDVGDPDISRLVVSAAERPFDPDMAIP
jgi:hypothetical protein